MNSSTRSASNAICGGNCQSTGPSLRPSASTPEAKKFASGVLASRNFFICVMKRGPFTANTKSAGVSSCHCCQAAGGCSEENALLRQRGGRLQRVERPVDLDRSDLARREFEFLALGQSRRIENAPPWRVS